MSIAAGQASSARRAVLRNPVFLVLWSIQAVTQTAQNVVNFSLVVMAQNLTGSSTHVAFIILSFSLPAVLFSSLAGVLVDRWDKRWVMGGSNIVRSAAVASYLLVRSGRDMPWVYVASFVFATAAQFFAPAEGAVIPRIVGRDHLIVANSLYNLTFMAAQFLGFTLIGWLVTHIFGLQHVFQLVSIVYVVAAVAVLVVPIPSMRTTTTGGNVLRRIGRELLEGWRFIVHRRTLLITIIHLSIANSMYLMLGALGPAFVSNVLHVRTTDLGLLLAPAGAFTLLGVVAVGRLATPENRHRMIHSGLAGVGLSILGLALDRPVTHTLSQLLHIPIPLTAVTVIAVLLSMPFGFSAAFIAIPAQTVLQENSPDEIRGRVLSTFFTVSNAASFFPIVLAGAVADLIGITQTLVLVGLFITTVAVVSQYGYVRSGYTWESSSRDALPT